MNSDVAVESQSAPTAADVAAGDNRPKARGTAGDHRRARGAEFGRLSHYIRDPFPALSHWVGALLAAVAMAALLRQGDLTAAGRLAVVIYGMSLVVLFASSAFSHTRHCSEAATLRLVKLDYAAIFLLIAGTYTPVMVLGLGGTAGYAILTAQWTLAAIGALLVTRGWRGKKFPTAARIVIYFVMGWLGMIFPGRILAALGWVNLIWLIAGGVMYTVGAIIFVTDRPKLWPGRFVAHDLWHLMVIAGAACHFVVVEALVRG